MGGGGGNVGFDASSPPHLKTFLYITMKFKDIKFKKMEHIDDGIQGLVELKNGLEVSIVKHRFSYGSDKGLYEIGVFLNDELVTPKGWDDQVKGYLDEDGVEQTIFELDNREAKASL
jgi:hypothetical protein